jgi:hypothetical protein
LSLRQEWLTIFLIITLVAQLNSVFATNGDNSIVEMSPGKVLPENKNHYLGTPEVKVKLEYPKAIILQQTRGDLLFNVTIESSKREIAIYIPYEFEIETSRINIWSTITNDYRYISLSTLSDRDPIAPLWFRVTVKNGTSNIYPGSHLIRLFNVTAPSIVGRYFFKIFIDGCSIGANNFPTLVVSADPNPAYISGTVLECSSDFFQHRYYTYGYYVDSKYGKPIQLKDLDGGKVVAEGIALDGRSVVGQAFFNASAFGEYTIYGLAAGTYNLTAYAAAYAPTTLSRLVSLRAGQSLDGVDLCIVASPRIEGVVWSKCGGMPIPWGEIANRTGPDFGAALVHLTSCVFPGRDFIYAFRGSNTSDFLRYDVLGNFWEPMQPAPGSVGPGGSLTFDGIRTIYAFAGGGTNSFWSYDVANDNWQTLFITPEPVGEGGSLAFNLNDGYIYALRGGGTEDFWRYDSTRDVWEILENTPDAIGAGGSLVFSSSDGKFYALQGGGSANFWQYVPNENSWSAYVPSLIPTAANAGAALTYNSLDDSIYAFAGGGTTNFYKYSLPPTDSWTSVPPTPSPYSINPGGSLTFDSGNGLIYALVGGNSTSFIYYTPDSWSDLHIFPVLYPRPITIEFLTMIDESLYLLENFTDPLSYSHRFSYDGRILLDGHIPQDSSGYISGIYPETYKIRVWVNEYYQHEDAIIALPNGVAVSQIEFDVYRAGRAKILIHFKDFPQGAETPVEFSKTVRVELYDYNAILRGHNSTRVDAGKSSSSIIISGFLGTLQDYGLPPGIYEVVVTVEGYYQPSDFFITISDCNSTSQASLEVVKTGSISLTIYSVNSQSPPQPQIWRYPGSSIRVEVKDQYEALIYKIAYGRQTSSSTNVSIFATDLRTGVYSIYISTFGYYQKYPYQISVIDGVTTDRRLDIIIGSTINLNIILEKEDIPAPIDTYPFSSKVPVRIMVYDDLDNFVAANATYIPAEYSSFNFQLIGFRSYAGKTSWRWNNYYDTTDGSIQSDYGIKPGLYRIIIWIPGYSQEGILIMTTVPESGSSSSTMVLHRLAHLSGTVTSLNMFGEVVPLNWAIVDAIGSETSDFAPTMDGKYDTWLEEGNYLLVCSLDGYETATKEVPLSKGSDVPIDFQLESILFTIPEFNNILYYLAIILLIINFLIARTRIHSFKKVIANFI